MAKASKATKKFAQKHLKGAIQRRKGVKNLKRQKEAKAQKWATSVQRGNDEEAAQSAEVETTKLKKRTEDMDVDEFLDGGFLEAEVGSGEEEEGSGDEGSNLDGASSEEEQDAAALPTTAGAAQAEAESSSDDEDDDHPVAAKNKQLRSEVKDHKAQLAALQEKDPEFYNYLQETDAELLGFGQESDDEAEAEEEKEEDESGEDRAAAGAQAGPSGRDHLGTLNVTSDMVDSWCAAAKDKASLGALRQLLKAYRVACHYGDTAEEAAAALRISSSRVFNRLLLFVLKEADAILRRALALEAAAAVQVRDVTRAARWRKLEPVVKSYLGNTLHLLGAMTEASMLAFVLRRVRASVIFLGPFEKLQRKFLRAALGIFGGADKAPRVQAILLIRAMGLQLPPPALDNCLKGVYRTFAANAKFVNAGSVPHLSFMAACVVEMFGLDAGAAYAQAFGHMREMAVVLRTALAAKTKDAFRTVYCWQYITCLELWAKLLAAHADKQELRALVYPVVQVAAGAARLVPTPRYFPLRLRLLRALNHLAAATGLLVPVAPLLLEMLHWADLAKPPTAGAGRPPNMALQLRVSKPALRTTAFQEEVLSQVLELLAEHLAQWAGSVAFPELSHLAALQLRRFAKAAPVERFRAQAKALVGAIERNAALVGRARDAADFSPKDLPQVAAFLSAEVAAKQLPMQQYAAQLAAQRAKRVAMQSSSSVELRAGRPTSLLDGGSEDEDEAEETAQLLQHGGADGTAGDEDDEQFEQDLLPARPRMAKAATPAQKPMASVGSDGEEDVVEDYVLSEDEESDDAQPMASDDEDEAGVSSSEDESDDAGAADGRTGGPGSSKQQAGPRKPEFGGGQHRGGGRRGAGRGRSRGGAQRAEDGRGGRHGGRGRGRGGGGSSGRGRGRGRGRH